MTATEFTDDPGQEELVQQGGGCPWDQAAPLGPSSPGTKSAQDANISIEEKMEQNLKHFVEDYSGKDMFASWVRGVKAKLESELHETEIHNSIVGRLEQVLSFDDQEDKNCSNLERDLMERLDKIQGWLEESHDRVSGTENSAAAESFLDNAKAEIELDIEHFRRPDVPRTEPTVEEIDKSPDPPPDETNKTDSTAQVEGGVLDLPMDTSRPTICPPAKPEEVKINWGAISTGARMAFGSHVVPEELKRIFEVTVDGAVPGGLDPQEEAALECLKALRKQGLTRDNYKNYMAIAFFDLLQAEEIKVAGWEIKSIEIQPYKVNKEFHVLVIPGILDGSPEVRKGDRLEITYKEMNYRMRVNKVLGDTLYLEFEAEWLKDTVFGFSQTRAEISVEFTVCDYIFSEVSKVLREMGDKMLDLFFPTHIPSKGIPMPCNSDESRGFQPVYSDQIRFRKRELKFFDENLPSNPEQSNTVLNILNQTARDNAYILFGPPGTGKTVTLVESIKQVWKMKPNTRLLVTAPSNAAADLLAMKLMEDIPEKEIVRLVAGSRDEKDLPPNRRFRRICRFTTKEYKLVNSVRVVVSTLVTSISKCIQSCNFHYVFVDEAGQATEAEVLLAVHWRLRKRGGGWVLAGDPHQLGPVVQAEFAKSLGLERSLMGRLMADFDMYKPDPETGEYDARYVTQLVRNFRSHETILEVPSEKFYNGGLMACADRGTKDFFRRFDWIKNPDCPVMFHGVRGQHIKDGQSPSLYNTEEIEVVKSYVNKLLESNQIAHEDIGVICPYRRQSRMIKDALVQMLGRDECGRDYGERIMVASTEKFQGQERLVMLISTVRSTTDEEGEWSRKLGFLINPQRFNVSVTRARSLLIVIGDPHLLTRDKCWGDYLEFAISKQAYVGCRYEAKSRREQRRQEVKERDREWNLVQKAREERIREAAAECGKSKDWIEALVKGLL